MFPCERVLSNKKACGHPLAQHDPCTAIVGKGKKATVCECVGFEPADLKERVASLTDSGDRAAALAALAASK